MKFRFSIDRGGTFTDIYCEVQFDDGRVEEVEAKLLSEDPAHYSDAPLEGIRRIMEQKMGCKIPTTKDIDTSKIEYVRMVRYIMIFKLLYCPIFLLLIQ